MVKRAKDKSDSDCKCGQLDSLGIDSIISYATNNPSIYISQATVKSIIMADRTDYYTDTVTVSTARWGCWASNSGALGCCNNHGSGTPCNRCRIICLIHDLICWNCLESHQLGGAFCGRNCVPE